MDRTQRQLIILVSLLLMLSVVMVFLFVYAPEPLQPFEFTLVLPPPIDSILSGIAGFIGLIIKGFGLLF